MSTIRFENVNKIYPNNVQAVFDFYLDVKDKEFVVFVGPSGCGKSTTLRMLAGLEEITDGKIYIDGECINDVEAKDRNIAMVFQNYALYPHMTVYNNMAFSLKMRKNLAPVMNEDGTQLLITDKPEIARLKKEINLIKKSWYLDPTIVELNDKIRKLKIYASKTAIKKGKEVKVTDKEEIKKLTAEIKTLQKSYKQNPPALCVEEIKKREDKIAELLKTPTAPAFVKVKIPKGEIDEKIKAAAEKLGLTEYLQRKPSALSGGQRQRVALGRAIVRNPRVFLMDEPLSNLDAKLRVQMRSEIIKIHKAANTTTIYVTHDQTEAMTMADRIVIMKDGYIQQIGAPAEIYNYPANIFVGGFIGNPAMNFLNGKIANGKFIADGDEKFTLSVKDIKGIADYEGKEIVLGIRPEDIGIVTDKTADFKMTCDISELLGYERIIYGYIGAQKFIVKVGADETVKENESYSFKINKSKIHFFDKETTKRVN